MKERLCSYPIDFVYDEDCGRPADYIDSVMYRCEEHAGPKAVLRIWVWFGQVLVLLAKCAEIQAYADGMREEERADVVAWIRRQAWINTGCTTGIMFEEAAKVVERGEHVGAVEREKGRGQS